MTGFYEMTHDEIAKIGGAYLIGDGIQRVFGEE